MKMLEVSNVSKTFGGVRALDRVSMRARPGEVLGIIGPNGSGKSTLLNILSGLVTADRGELRIGRQRYKLRRTVYGPRAAQHAGIARTFQAPRLFEDSSVLDNMLMALTPRNLVKNLFVRDAKLRNRARELLGEASLWAKHEQLAGRLSFGQKKILEIARAAAVSGKIILLDEPLAGLFVHNQEVVSRMIRSLRAQGRAVILVEHDMRLIRSLSDRVVVLDSGKVIAEGRPVAVFNNKKVQAAYLGT